MLLSICIPTYNRAEYLHNAIESITAQPEWESGAVEIVISDNGSTDDTPEVIANLQKRYGTERIRSRHLDTPIDTHDNFTSALNLGQGRMLKLQNDTCCWQPGALAQLLAIIEGCQTLPDLLLTPNHSEITKVQRCDSMDDVVKNVSYYLTWIGTLGISRKTWENIDDPMRCRDLKLPQVELVARVMASGGTALCCEGKFFQVQEIGHRVGYQVAEVFCRNYFSILMPYISREVMEKEKRRLLNEYLIRRHFDFFKEFNTAKQTGYWQNTAVYHRNFYFYLSFAKVAVLRIISWIFTHDELRKIKNFLQRKNRS